MFKRIKESPTYEKFKDLWSNQKTRSMIKLGLWLVFITFVIIFVRRENATTYIEEPVTNNYSTSQNYEFTYQTNNQIINGQTFNDKIEFYVNNQRYYYDKNVYSIKNDNAQIQPNYDLGILKINLKMINNLISGITGTEIDNYKQYLVPLDRFINLYDIDTDIDLSKATSYNIIINIYKENNVVSKVTLDLTNYKLYTTGQIESYIINIYYYNVNNVSDFSKHYNQMIGGQS